LEMLKKDLEKLVSEILFLGGSKNDLIELIEKVNVVERDDAE